MPGTKRPVTKIAAQRRQGQPDKRQPVTSESYIMDAFCTVCGRTIPQNKAVKHDGSITTEVLPYFEAIGWNPDQPFGRRLPTTGRGSLKNWSYINKEDAPELFEALRERMLMAIRLWIDRGWIKREEI